ncbi:uncharacterized protein E0L32_002873 [Thyridium curvatum]|uniref:FAD-binding PCMH-type domain-containing protein n=1 Tax=Thyridium curvatum TaxID=1093900 RepID=A0A507B694_9PEZI|nr:uncharacterized protein E0L32_002873 [Thyridium curvatum]TPX17772.1 hypothetical protein E0L32_002873 [Thyridium curvatum]
MATENQPDAKPDFDQLAEDLLAKNVPIKRSVDQDWLKYAQTFNARLQYEPALIVVPNKVLHVQEAVVLAAKYGTKVQVKSGGHSYASFSTGGIDGIMVIDMQEMREICVNHVTGVFRVSPGVRLGELDSTLYNLGRPVGYGSRAIAHGTHRTGLAMDHIIALDVVLADGRHLAQVSRTRNPELFWVSTSLERRALRGAADSIGVVTQFYLQSKEAPDTILNFRFAFTGIINNVNDAVKTFKHVQAFAQDPEIVDRDLGLSVFINGDALIISGIYMGPHDTFFNVILPALYNDQCLPEADIVNIKTQTWAEYSGIPEDDATPIITQKDREQQSNFFAKSVTVSKPIPDAALVKYFRFLQGQAKKASVGWYVIVNLHGGPDSQINTRSSSFAAFGSYDALWVFQHFASVGVTEKFPEEGFELLEGMNSALTQELDEYAAELVYVDPTLSRDEAHELYYGAELYQRLQGCKRWYDPLNLFDHPHSIRG